jgi:hypothetical protein
MPNDINATQAEPARNSDVHKNAEDAVINKGQLDMGEFIEKQWPNIETRLLYAQEKHPEPAASVEFFAECLPYAAAIVHAGSTPQHFIDAKEWARRLHPLVYADEVSILALLTFVFLVDEGVRRSRQEEPPNPEKQKKWMSIKSRLDGLLGEKNDDSA